MARNNGLDGLINLHKPTGISSARALYRIRGVTGQRKSGHGGTLDPMASGVLILCLGKATKLVERLMDLPKVYRATARLDVTSKSFDGETPLVEVKVAATPTAEAIADRCADFEGFTRQVPPLTSAVKVDGQPAYKRARANQCLQLNARAVRIDWIHLHAYAWPTLDFEVCCGRGTYIRSLIRDLGEALGVGGTLTSLARTRVGPFTLDDAWTPRKIAGAGETLDFLIDLERARAMLESPQPPVRPGLEGVEAWHAPPALRAERGPSDSGPQTS